MERKLEQSGTNWFRAPACPKKVKRKPYVSLSPFRGGERDKSKPKKGKPVEANQVKQTGSGQQGVGRVATVQLRADYADTRAMMVEYGEWTIEQSKEIGAGIADAVKAAETGDYGELRFWCDWFAIRGEAARSLRLVGDAVLDNLRRAA